ncbi:MAG: phosphohydrolase [Thermoplasmata archaeon]|nr:MAG: phosphohydrolase [Thermoplasmata archaeon]
MINVRELRDGQRVFGKFVVRAKEAPREYKSKEGMYFMMEVGNRTGDILLKYWGGVDKEALMSIYASIDVGDVVEVDGIVSYDSYRNRLAIVVDAEKYGIRKCSENEYNIEDYIKVSEKDLDLLFLELMEYIKSVNDDDYRRLLNSLFSDEEFSKKFKYAPSAIAHHHNYLGGLLEHTLNVVKICDLLCKIYPELDRALLITAAILHDIGKIYTYTYRTSIVQSDTGRFMGHLILSYDKVRDLCQRLGISGKKAELLLHAILVHHGDSDDRVPVKIKTPEACALHYADKLDAYVKDYLQAVEGAVDTPWSYDRVLKHEVYTGSD